MIKELAHNEIQGAADMAPLFFEEGQIPGEFNPEVFVKSWATLIKLDMGKMYALVVEGKEVGYLGMIVTQDINDGAKIAQEAFWFVHPDHRGSGLKLLLHAEKCAKELSCKRMGMVHLSNTAGEKLSHIFNRMGFREIEVHYIKELNPPTNP